MVFHRDMEQNFIGIRSNISPGCGATFHRDVKQNFIGMRSKISSGYGAKFYRDTEQNFTGMRSKIHNYAILEMKMDKEMDEKIKVGQLKMEDALAKHDTIMIEPKGYSMYPLFVP